MSSYLLRETYDFSKSFKKLPTHIQNHFEQKFKKLVIDPYHQGKPLGYKWFRELKTKRYRVYFLVYREEVIVLFVGVSTKKKQQETINHVLSNIQNFRKELGNRKD